MNSVDNNSQIYTEEYYKGKFLENSALSEHYARQKIINSSNSDLYYRYASLEYYYKSLALYYKGFFSALGNMQ